MQTKPNFPDRFFEEFDYERRLKKRKSKLISATEEAFAHLGRVSEERVKGIQFLSKSTKRPPFSQKRFILHQPLLR